jgi:predicted RNA-binding protein with PUA-like domain
MPYLLKSEPESYSYSDLEREGQTTWDGVKNPQALMNLAGMKKGEKLVFYHTVTEKAVVGTAHVVSVDASNAKSPIVRIAPDKRLKQPKTLAEMREAPVFRGSLLFRQFRLSVVPLTDAQYDWLLS